MTMQMNPTIGMTDQPDPSTEQAPDEESLGLSISATGDIATPDPIAPAPLDDLNIGYVDHSDPNSVNDWYQQEINRAGVKDTAPPADPPSGPPGAGQATTTGGGKTPYPQGVEQWRALAEQTMPKQLRDRPDAKQLVNKMLHVINYESGGDPTAQNQTSTAHGLVQNIREKSDDPATQLRNGWALVAQNPDKWTDWGEDNLWLNPATGQKEPFGALGLHPFNGSNAAVQAVTLAGRFFATPSAPAGIAKELTPQTSRILDQARKNLLDSVNNVTDQPAIAELLNQYLPPTPDKMTPEQIDQTVAQVPDFLRDDIRHQLEQQANVKSDRDIALEAFKQGLADNSGDPEKAWEHMVAILRDTYGNANPNVLQLADVAAMVGSAGAAGLAEGGIKGALLGAGKAGLGLAAGQASEQYLPDTLPFHTKEFITNALTLSTFTVPEQGILRGGALAAGGAATSTGYSAAGGPGIVNIPGVGSLGNLLAILAGSGITSRFLTYPTEVSRINQLPQTPNDVAQGRYVLEHPGGGRLEYRDTPQGAHIMDVVVPDEGQGTGSALMSRAVTDIRTRNPNAIITADLNSEAGVKLFSRSPEALFLSRDGTIISPREAAERAANYEGPSVQLHPNTTALYDHVLNSILETEHGVMPLATDDVAWLNKPTNASAEPSETVESRADIAKRERASRAANPVNPEDIAFSQDEELPEMPDHTAELEAMPENTRATFDAVRVTKDSNGRFTARNADPDVINPGELPHFNSAAEAAAWIKSLGGKGWTREIDPATGMMPNGYGNEHAIPDRGGKLRSVDEEISSRKQDRENLSVAELRKRFVEATQSADAEHFSQVTALRKMYEDRGLNPDTAEGYREPERRPLSGQELQDATMYGEELYRRTNGAEGIAPFSLEQSRDAFNTAKINFEIWSNGEKPFEYQDEVDPKALQFAYAKAVKDFHDYGEQLWRRTNGEEGLSPRSGQLIWGAPVPPTVTGDPTANSSTSNYGAGLPKSSGFQMSLLNQLAHMINPLLHPAGRLKDLKDYRAEVEAGTSPWVGTVLRWLGINKSADPTIGKVQQIVIAAVRQRMEAGVQVEASLKAFVDTYMQHWTGMDRLFEHAKGDNGILRVVHDASGETRDVPWNDVYERPNEYRLNADQKDAIRDARRYVNDIEEMRKENGLKPLGANFTLDGYGYMPRQVETIRGIETQKSSSAKHARTHETAAEGNAAGIKYSGIRDALFLHATTAYREVMEAQLQRELEPYQVKPSKLIDQSLVSDMKTTIKEHGQAVSELNALQRNRIRLQTAGIVARTFSALRQTRFATIGDLAQGVRQLNDSVGLLIKERNQIRLDKMPRSVLEDAEDRLLQARSDLKSLRDYQAKVQAGSAVLGTPVLGTTVRLLRDERIKALKENAADITAARGKVTYMARQKENARQAYAAARKVAEGRNQADATLFPQSARNGEIPIKLWKGKFMPSTDVEALERNIGRFNQEKPNIALRAFNTVGDATRFLSLFMHFTAPLVHGLPTLFHNPKVWAEGSFAQVVATFDPVYQSDYARKHLASIQEMAQHGVPTGGNDMFGGERGLLNDAAGVMKRLPMGEKPGKVLDGIIKQTYGRSGGAYSMALLNYRVGLWESMRDGYARTGNLPELGRVIRNATGALDSKALGAGANQRSIEAMWLAFSPRLLRSTAALFADSVRGLAGGSLRMASLGHAGEWDPALRSNLVSMAGMISSSLGLFVLTGMALGKTPDEIRDGMNPLHGKKFLSYEVDGQYFGIGGEVRSMAQFLYHAIDSGAHNPGAFLKSTQANPLVQYATSRGSPGWSLGTGIVGALGGPQLDPYSKVEDFQDLYHHIVGQSTPFAAKELIKDGDQGIYPAIATTFGVRSSVATAADQLTASREEARAAFGADPNIAATITSLNALPYELDPQQIANLQGVFKTQTYNEFGAGEKRLVDAWVAKQHPDLAAAYQDARRNNGSIYQVVADHADNIKEQYGKQYDAVWDELKAGRDPREVQKALDTIRNKEQGALNDIYGNGVDPEKLSAEAKEYQDAIKNLQPSDIRKVEDQWFAIVQHHLDKDGSTIDWDGVDKERGEFFNHLSQTDPAMSQRLPLDLDMSDSLAKAKKPEIMQFKAEVDQMLNPYYNIAKGSEHDVERQSWLAQNPVPNAMGWMFYGEAIHSVAAIESALSFGITRDKDANGQDIGLRLSGSKLHIDSSNIQILQQYRPQIDRILQDHGKVTIGRTEMSNIQLLREQSPIYDTLYYALGFDSPDKSGQFKGTVAVYHDVSALARQMGFPARTDARPRYVAPRR